MEEYKPYFMLDDSDKDGHAEPIMDYVLCWCLRNVSYRYVKDFQPVLYHYCKYILCKLIKKLEQIDYVTFEKVTVKRQEKNIDLWVEVQLSLLKPNEDKQAEYHAILIENKYYKGLRENQLEEYRPIFDQYYSNRDYKLHYALVSCLYHNDPKSLPLKQSAHKNGFDYYHIYDLLDGSKGYPESESDIFNEFFIRDWL